MIIRYQRATLNKGSAIQQGEHTSHQPNRQPKISHQSARKEHNDPLQSMKLRNSEELPIPKEKREKLEFNNRKLKDGVKILVILMTQHYPTFE